MPGERRGQVGWESDNPYYEGKKHREPTVCVRCGLLYRDGHWQWAEEVVPEAARAICPACRREIDRYPGGYVLLKGAYCTKHWQEILNLIKNQEEEARRTRPLHRILWIEPRDAGMEIATTTAHLARRLGKAIQSAHKGELSIHQAAGEPLVRLVWRRD